METTTDTKNRVMLRGADPNKHETRVSMRYVSASFGIADGVHEARQVANPLIGSQHPWAERGGANWAWSCRHYHAAERSSGELGPHPAVAW